jgi:DNA-binding transcriptional LysR family regulator
MGQYADPAAAQVFAAVVEHQSFRAAAAALGMPKSTVSRKVAELEERLGARLLERTTRSLRLTDMGTAYLAQAAPAVAMLADAERVVEQLKAEPQGVLRVSMPGNFGQMFLGDMLADFREQFPKVRLVIELADRNVDLVEEGFDAAMRAGALSDSSLVARRIAASPIGYYASPGYLAARGEPVLPNDLAAHDCIVFDARMATWPFTVRRKQVTVRVTGPVVVNSFASMRTLAVRGHGIARIPAFMVETQLAAGELIPVLAAYQPPPTPLHIVYPSARSLSPKVRAFVEFAAKWLEVERWNQNGDFQLGSPMSLTGQRKSLAHKATNVAAKPKRPHGFVSSKHRKRPA